MTVVTQKNSSYTPSLPLLAGGVALLSAIDSQQNTESSSSSLLEQFLWKTLVVGATAYGAHHVFTTTPTVALSAETMITVATATILLLNRSLAHYMSQDDSSMGQHTQTFITNEDLQNLTLHADGSLIVVPEEAKPNLRSLALPIFHTYLLSRAVNQSGCFGFWGPYYLAAARNTPRLIEDFSNIWSGNTMEHRILAFYSRKAVTLPSNPEFNCVLKLIVQANRSSRENENNCSICLNPGGKYSICEDPRHAMHYKCFLENVLSQWQAANPLHIVLETVDGRESLRPIFDPEDPVFNNLSPDLRRRLPNSLPKCSICRVLIPSMTGVWKVESIREEPAVPDNPAAPAH